VCRDESELDESELFDMSMILPGISLLVVPFAAWGQDLAKSQGHVIDPAAAGVAGALVKRRASGQDAVYKAVQTGPDGGFFSMVSQQEPTT
jgi:hypothetical protein